MKRGFPPLTINYILRIRIAPEDMKMDAFEKGNISLLISLILMYPWTKSEKQAKSLLNDIKNKSKN